MVFNFGTPRRFLTDNGANFVSEAVGVVCQRLGIAKIQTSVEHPQTDGLVEQMNRTIKTSLSVYCQNHQPAVWDEYLPFITFAINTSKQKSSNHSTFETMYRRQAVIPPLEDLLNVKTNTFTSKSGISYLNHFLPLLHQDLKQNIQRSQQQQQKQYKKHRKKEENFDVGDSVLKIKMKEAWKFSEPKFSGPWTILKITNAEKTAFLLGEATVQGRKQRNTTANIRDIYKV